MPVDAVTLGAWLVFKSEARGPERVDKQVTPGTLKKYLSGIRWQHIVNGHKWPFGGDAWLKLVRASIAKEFPTKIFVSRKFLFAINKNMAKYDLLYGPNSKNIFVKILSYK